MRRSVILYFLLGALGVASAAGDGAVHIRDGLPYVDTLHEHKPVRVQRNQDNDNMLPFEFALTSRPCPPYCIQPMRLAPGVETIGELEVLDYLARIGQGEHAVLLVDSREPRWLASGMIPGARNLPWTLFHAKSTTPAKIAHLLEFEFRAVRNGELWDFNAAKTLIFYCNGPWCGQSPTAIRALLTAGYPPERIKWYRAGMQGWLQLGLTTVKPVGTK